MATEGMTLSRAVRRLGLSLADDELDTLNAYAGILADRGVDEGLVSRSDRDRVLDRHVIDCLRVLPLLRAGDGRCLDLGSGGGLPGIVVAIGAPGVAVELIESRRRRVAFLELVVETLHLPNVTVRHERIEDARGSADVCLARALAPPGRAWALARPLLRPGGRLLFFAGMGASPQIEGPGAPLVELVRSPLLESSGPLVIMTPQ